MKSATSKNSIKASKNIEFAILATDIVLWTIRGGRLHVRLVSVNVPPQFTNFAGLPGGLLHPNETAEQAAARLVSSKAGIPAGRVYMEQLYTFSGIGRDPLGRVVAVAYIAMIPWENLSTLEQENTEQAWWCDVQKLPRLAYDHAEMIKVALERLQAKLTYTTLIGNIMPKEFTLTELEEVYESVLDTDIDKRNFRKKILKLNLLKALPKERRGLKSRPAKLYSFRSLSVVPIEVL